MKNSATLDSIVLNKEKALPSFLLLLSFVEMWERFSYYGMRALLVIYLTSQLGFSDPSAYALYSLFAAVGYAGPPIFGILADKIFGAKYVILLGGITITIGHLVMALGENVQNGIFLGLACIAIGTGAFKGNITNLLGACYKNDPASSDNGFTIFYVSINLGACISAIACGYVAKTYGWNYGFGLAGLGMILGLVAFIRLDYILKNEGNRVKDSKLSMNLLLISGISILIILTTFALQNAETFTNILNMFGLVMLNAYLYIYYKATAKDRVNLITILIMAIFLCLFFGMEMQLGSLISLFTDRNIDKVVFGIEISAAMSQAINPFSIIILGSIIGTLKSSTKNQMLKITFGLATISICFGILYLGCLNANINGEVNYLYLLIAVIMMSIGELLIAPVIQSQVSLLAPAQYKGFIMGILMLSLAFANTLGGALTAKLMSVPQIDGHVNMLESLKIYSNGFQQVALYNLVVVLVFILSIPILNRAYKKTS
jgi:POT family proton-dependent oligopeptide transporter